MPDRHEHSGDGFRQLRRGQLDVNHNNGDTFPVGTTTVTFTATDIHGNVTTSALTYHHG